MVRYFFIFLFSLYSICAFAKGYNPPSASLVVDYQTGKILHQENANMLRKPASLTKMMTIYLAFEAVENRQIGLNQLISASARAVRAPRLNLDLKPGMKMTVKQAIIAAIVHSANDATVMLAEAISGSEEKFAHLMNSKAKQLGMKDSHFMNSSGLPHKNQKSTAVDLAKLAIALRRDFPKYYHYFSIEKFTYNKRTWYSHNRVTLNYKWADGLKTGFTSASGFNLVTSASKGKKRLIGVVLGSPSVPHRDKKMMKLLDNYLH